MTNKETAVSIESENPEQGDLRWVRLTAGIVSLLGMAGLVALMSQGAWAAPPSSEEGHGLRPGNRTFTNPFANTGGAPSGGNTGKPAFFEDDTEDEVNLPPRGQNPGAPGGGAPSVSVNAAAAAAGATLTGQPPGGVVSKKEVPPIHVDSETGEGSKELVTDFNFPDADIMDIAKTLGKLTGKNFILDKDVKGRVSIVSNSPITVGDAWRAFLTALDMTGFALVPSGKYIRITRQRDARDKQLRTYTGESSPDTDALITRVFTLKYIDAEEVARTFRSFMPANSRVIPYDQTNTVIVTDTGANIAKLAKMLELLDVEGYDLGIEVVPVKYASAADLSKLIDQLIPGQGGAPGAPGAPRFGGGMGGRFNARRTKEGGVINTIIADDRTNTLIVNANTKGVEQVRELVARLDQKIPAQQGGGKVHVKYLQFADAEAVANTLNALSTGGGGRPMLGSIPGGGTSTGVNPVAQSLFEGAIKVAPDKATNSLVVTASPSDFEKIEQVVNRLDIPRDEVYVEIVVMEVSLQKAFDYSSSVAVPSQGIALTPNTDLFSWIKDPTSVNGAVIGFQSDAKTTLTIGGTSVSVPNVAALIRAIQTNAKANVLATPQIVALDNEEASFESTEKIPVLKSTAVQGVVSTTADFQNVTLSIKIKPQINRASNFIKLKINTKIGNIEKRGDLPPAVAQQALATLERTADTNVFVGDADTVVIGGLIRDNVADTVSKIPLLGDIPVLGWLFRAKNTTIDKTNLLMFLTPHIVRKYERIRAILDRKLKERDEFIEREAGGEDAYRRQRDEMIRRLPDLKSLSQERPTAFSVGGEDVSSPAKPAPKAPSDLNMGAPGANSTAPVAPPTADPSANGAANGANGSAGGPVSAPPADAPQAPPAAPPPMEDVPPPPAS